MQNHKRFMRRTSVDATPSDNKAGLFRSSQISPATSLPVTCWGKNMENF